MTTNKVFIKTHGCQMNEYDSSRMLDLLKESHGYELTDQESEADLLLLNTCSIRERRKKRCFISSGAGAKLKQGNQTLKLALVDVLPARKGRLLAKGRPTLI